MNIVRVRRLPVSLVPVAAMFGVALSLAGCKKRAEPSETSEKLLAGHVAPKLVTFDPAALERLGIKVESAGARGGELDLEVPGTLEYSLDRYAEVGTMVDGRVMAINVKPGDRVKKGQALATIAVPTLAMAQAEYISAEAAARIAKDNELRETTLLERQLTTAREAELARGDAIRTGADLGAAKAKLDALGVSHPRAGTSVSSSGVLRLDAPLDGVVVRRDAILGRYLSAKETAFVIADPQALRASLTIYEVDLPYLQIGQEAEISIDAMPGKVRKGKIVSVEPQVGKASRSARAYLDVDNRDGTLKPGMFIRASLQLDQSAGAGRLLVPAPAVQPLGDAQVVFVEQKPGVYEVRKVVVVRKTTQVAEIGEGVTRNDRIVVDGAFVLRGEVTKQ